VSKLEWWCVIWGPWFLYLAGFELPAALWKGCPWPTLSWGAWTLQKLFPWLTIVFIAGFAVLTSHLERTKNVQEGD
jgi:hypothetical protein